MKEFFHFPPDEATPIADEQPPQYRKRLSDGVYEDPPSDLPSRLNEVQDLGARTKATILSALEIAKVTPSLNYQIDNIQNKFLSDVIDAGVAQWSVLSEEQQLEIWHSLRQHTEHFREVPAVIRIVSVLVGRRPTETTGETLKDVIPEEVYEKAAGTYWLLVQKEAQNELDQLLPVSQNAA